MNRVKPILYVFAKIFAPALDSRLLTTSVLRRSVD